MPPLIRQANANDAPQWLEVIKSALGADYPDSRVYDAKWVGSQIISPAAGETWVAESGGRLAAVATFLPPLASNHSPVANLGRSFALPEALQDGTAEAFLAKITEIALSRNQLIISRIQATETSSQTIHEKLGYVCAGFQPFKHLHRVRQGTLFYLRIPKRELGSRLPLSESLPQVHELAVAVLGHLQIAIPTATRDGAVGYPLQTDVKVSEVTVAEFERQCQLAQSTHPPVEISGAFNLGFGLLRFPPAEEPFRAVLAQRDDKVVAGLSYYFDSIDRCARIISSFSADDLSMGSLLQHVVKTAQEQFTAVYIEIDVLVTAPRLLKSAEQLGFVPIAYLPAFFNAEGGFTDVIKLVKLNMVYSPENASFTTHARRIVEIVDHNFQDQKVGVAIINLLRTLPIFDGLGDGELRKIARLFTQKLFRPGEKIFNRGETGNEAYVVMRGQVDIVLEGAAKPIASIANGQIFGEQAFLDGAARGAMAVAAQPSILLVVQRSAFNQLVQHEPHLGMVVTRNIAIELSSRLRRTNAAIAPSRT